MHSVKKLSRYGPATGRESYIISQYISTLYTWGETKVLNILQFRSFSDSIQVPYLMDSAIIVNSEYIIN